MRRTATALLIAGLVTGGAAEDPLAGRVAGPPATCIGDSVTSLGPTVIDRNTITYSRTARRIWVVHPADGCPALAPLTTLVIERWGSQTCSGDRFRVLEPGALIPSAYCRFGRFVPYDKPR